MKSLRVFLSFLFDVLLEGVTKRVIVRVVFSPRSRGQVWRVLYKSKDWDSPLLSSSPECWVTIIEMLTTIGLEKQDLAEKISFLSSLSYSVIEKL